MCLFLYKTGDTSPGLIRLAFSNILVVAFNMGLRYAFAVGEEGGGGIQEIYSSQIQHKITNWTQSDLRFCKNEGSERSKINEKGGSIG